MRAGLIAPLLASVVVILGPELGGLDGPPEGFLDDALKPHPCAFCGRAVSAAGGGLWVERRRGSSRWTCEGCRNPARHAKAGRP